MNPARKQRQFAPKLQQPRLSLNSVSTSLNSSAEDEKDTEGNVEEMKGKTIGDGGRETEEKSDSSRDEGFFLCYLIH